MTANELANELQKLFVGEEYDRLVHEIPDLLRQQQAELDAFKLQYYNTGYSLQLRDKDEAIKQQAQEIENLRKELALQKLSDISQEIETLDTRSYLIGRYDGLRELTDGEILNIYIEQTNGNKDLDILEFARAILRKASEK